jgi:ribosomal-protein-alanine acetyltransferase
LVSSVRAASASEPISRREAEETVTFMQTDPLSDFGLRPVTLADRPAMDRYFESLREPLSDYTFSQLFTWRNSLRIAWNVIENHLCVFANGSGDLTLLLPPIGDSGSDRALSRAAEIMDQYNSVHGCREKSRVEYVSEELLGRFDRSKLAAVNPQGTDYLYDVGRMIELAGGDLASKRQAKNRFMRNYRHRVERYDAARHFHACRALLDSWKQRQDDAHAGDDSSSFIKRTKESLATQLSLEHAGDLGLSGLVVYVEDEAGTESIKGFTFGEALGRDQSSIVVEKTDLECKGLAQFIYSEFCRTAWADRPLVNAGDDWGLETLAWTKMSYRPVKLLKKYALTPPAVVAVGVNCGLPIDFGELDSTELVEVSRGADCGLKERVPAVTVQAKEDSPAGIEIRAARRADLFAISALEQGCFNTYNLNKRQLQYLQQRQSNVFLVAEQGGRIVGEGIALVRHHKQSISGRVYSLAVDPASRGQGIGEKLMREMIEQLRCRDVRRIYLEVEASNTSAIHLYERLGFASIGTLPDYYGEGRPGVHMMAEIGALRRPVAA